MPNTLESLRQIIDEQDVGTLQQFIAKNQQIDYDNISPNGASALWWALMPPTGKTANKAIVDCLLDARKTDGSHLVSPVQTFSGITPRQYVTCFGGTGEVESAIERAENQYVRPQDTANVRNLAAIAADGQSAHDATVGALTRANIIRLHQHYVKDNSNLLNKKTVEMAGKEIAAFLDALQKEQRVDAEQMRYGLGFCYNNPSRFEFQPSEENSETFSLTLAQLTALNWIAAKEQDADFLPAGATDEEALDSRKKAILNILYDIATAYGKNRASCAGGACNRLGMALASQHKLVQAYAKGEKIKGEMAGLVVLRILGQAIARLSEDNKEAYWTIIRYMALDAEEESYQKVISANKESLLEQMIEENIDENYANDFIEALDYSYPLSNHKTSYQLAELMGMMHKFELDLTQFDDSTAFDNKINTAVEVLAKERLKHSKSFLSLKEKFGVSDNDNDLALEKQFILHWLELTRRRQRTDDLHAFINAAKPSEFAEECFLLSFFSNNKEKLKQENPAQEIWLENLTDEQIIDLMSAVIEASPHGIGKINDFMQQLLLKAMELGFTAHLSFENMHINNKDLRAFDFSGTSLRNVSFENCLLPFAGSNIHCQNVKMLDCQLPGIDSSSASSEKDFAGLLLKLCSVRNYASSSLLIQFLLDQISERLLLCAQDRRRNALILATQNNHIDIVKAILASDKCSQKLLERCYYHGSILMTAARNGHTEIVKAILASGKCSQKYIELGTLGGKNALALAAKYGHTETVKAILESGKCSQELIEKTNRHGDSALILAANKGHTKTAEAILTSGKCPLKLLRYARVCDKFYLLDLSARAWDSDYEVAEVRKIYTQIAYQALWESEDSKDKKALAVLRDYCKGTAPVLSSLSLFAHGHINRHHTDTVRHLLKEYERGHVDLPMILDALKDLKPNQDGSLACRLRFIESRLPKEEAEEESQSPRPPGL